MTTLRDGQRGQSLVEFALIFPIFLLIVVAAIDLGRGVFAYNSITNAAREAARLAIVNQTLDDIRARAIGQTFVAAADPTKVTVSYFKSGPNRDPESNPSCFPVQVGCLVVVEYESKFELVTPIVRSLLFPTGVDLTARTVLPVEAVCSSSCLKEP